MEHTLNSGSSQIQIAEQVFAALANQNKQEFLDLQTEDIVWQVGGNLAPTATDKVKDANLIPFAGNWQRNQGISDTVGDFYDRLQDSLVISRFEPLDFFEDDDLVVARVNLEATVKETNLPFEVDMVVVMEMENAENGQPQLESVEVIYESYFVAQAFAGQPVSPEATALDEQDSTTGISLGTNPEANSQESLEVVTDAYEELVKLNLDGFTPAFAEDAQLTLRADPAAHPVGGIWEGPEGVTEFFGTAFGFFSPVVVNPRYIIANGDRVVVISNQETAANETGLPFTFSSAHVLTVEDGKITNLEFVVDTYASVSALEGAPLFLDEPSSATPSMMNNLESLPLNSEPVSLDNNQSDVSFIVSDDVESDSSAIPVVEEMLRGLANQNKEDFFEGQTEDVFWRVVGNTAPISPDEVRDTDIIPFAGDWHRIEGVSKTVSDFFARLHESLRISQFEILDFFEEDNLVIARVNTEATVKETGLSFDLDLAYVVNLEESEDGNKQIESVEVVYNSFPVAEAFAGESPSPEAIDLVNDDPLTGIPQSLDFDANSEESLEVVTDAYESFLTFEVEEFAENFTEDAVIAAGGDPSQIPIAGIWEGQAGAREIFFSGLEVFDPKVFNPVEIIANGDRVAVVNRQRTAVIENEFPFDFTSVHFLTVQDNSIANWELLGDTYISTSALVEEPLFVPEQPLTIDAIFNEDYYLEHNPEAATAVARGDFANGLEHFTAVGIEQGLRFSPLIDLDHYQRVANPDLASLTKRQALEHLLETGIAEGRLFSPFIDLDFYREANPDLAHLSNSDAFLHLQEVGLDAGLQFSTFVDLAEYRSFSPELADLSLSETFSHLATFYAPEDEGRIRFPLGLELDIPDEIQVVTSEMLEGSAETTITYSKSDNRVTLDLDLVGLPYRETFTRPEDVSTPYNQQLTSVEDAQWQVWLIGHWFTIETTYWYDGQTKQLIGNEFDIFEQPPTDETPIDVNDDGVIDTPVKLPTAQMIGSPIFEGNPDGTAQISLEYTYDSLLDELGTAGSYASVLPYNLDRPEEVGVYYTEGGLPLSEAMSWDDILTNIRSGNRLNITLSVEPNPKPSFLDARPNTMGGWNGFYPFIAPEGIVYEPGTDSYRFAEPEDLVTHANEPYPGRLAAEANESELVFGDLEDNRLDAADPADDFDGNRDRVFAGAGNDFVDASQVTTGHNQIFGGAGRDELLANYRDRLFGGTGDDILDATVGSGNNRLYGDEGDDELYAGIADRLFGGTGNDLLNAAVGSGGNSLYGQAGDDLFFAKPGDRLAGGDGDDVFFVGNGGDNLITGGEGADAFWISTGELVTTANIITDLELDSDVIGVAGIGATAIADLDFQQVANDTVISFSGRDLAIVRGIDHENLQAANFVFA